MTIKTVILCGGLGTRIGAETKKIPKPMIKINKKPLIEYIMRKFISHGFEEFILATGYKHKIVENYFKNKKYNVKCVFTGIKPTQAVEFLKLKNF